ncbi:hypothetical protein BRD19_00360 [Halobacteriales archaeon SW_7_65_23]|nr:MAG: hypothetical protein BRD19_00360 [Halobacteriales archaeon SW_7_65_23]
MVAGLGLFDKVVAFVQRVCALREGDTAAEFFDARGYEEAAREEAPGEIRNTTEFSDLCPDSAACLRRTL